MMFPFLSNSTMCAISTKTPSVNVLYLIRHLVNQVDRIDVFKILRRKPEYVILALSEIEENGRRYAVATIDADVQRGGEIDPTFVLDINGVDGIYANGSELKFKAKVYGHDAYIHLFWFDETGGSVIFPSNYEKKRLFIKETEYTFPVNQHMQYLMERMNPDSEYETINLIAVATKRDIPFLEENITFESLLKWIYAIPADERAAWREAVVIK